MSLIRGAGSMSAIEITRQDLSISQLRAEAARTADAKQARRILAIAMVLDEHPRLLAAQAGGMDRPDAARLGSSLQRRRLGGAREKIGSTSSLCKLARGHCRRAEKNQGIGKSVALRHDRIKSDRTAKIEGISANDGRARSCLAQRSRTPSRASKAEFCGPSPLATN